MFVNEEEQELSNDFIKNGFIKRKVEDIESLEHIKKKLLKIVSSYKGLDDKNITLENIHDHISQKALMTSDFFV